MEYSQEWQCWKVFLNKKGVLPLLIKKIQKDIKQAIKNKEKVKLNTLRSLLSKAETEKGRIGLKSIDDFSDNEIILFINIHLKMLSQELESLVEAGRDTSHQELQRNILLSYLPKQLNDKEIIEEVRHAISLVKRGEYNNPMQYLSLKLRGKADMGLVHKTYKKIQKEENNRNK